MKKIEWKWEDIRQHNAQGRIIGSEAFVLIPFGQIKLYVYEALNWVGQFSVNSKTIHQIIGTDLEETKKALESRAEDYCILMNEWFKECGL